VPLFAVHVVAALLAAREWMMSENSNFNRFVQLSAELARFSSITFAARLAQRMGKCLHVSIANFFSINISFYGSTSINASLANQTISQEQQQHGKIHCFLSLPTVFIART
jgi:hypothetical protein